ncbi:uncharacterized protein LOC142178886 [Nicotiana tabacum]|uniref:Uncharacterized protein LOC142178886 n=1 Tax=Nicotiana tabacum TaxID=4097 RepID=A0AC58U5M0_TOBAC
MWVKGLPFKISFFMWKLWKGKLPLDDVIRRMGYYIPSKCWCCVMPKEETLSHVFYRSLTALKVWSYFYSHAGLSLEGLNLHLAIVKCWTTKVIPRLKPIFQALPSIIVWELWKRRNNNKRGKAVSTNRVVYQVCNTIQSLIKLRKPGIDRVPFRWTDILRMMENYTPKLKFNKVLWELPMTGWTKINTDGASRGNPGRSSIGFCLRNEEGDLVYACEKEIQEVETDSMLLKKVITREWKPPWVIEEEVKEIRQMLMLRNGRITHIFREGNNLADHLANYALDQGVIECHSFHHLDTQGRRLVNGHKIQCPFLRVKASRQ